jgi:hypothetical protein
VRHKSESLNTVDLNTYGYLAIEIRRCCADPSHELKINSGSQMKPITLGLYGTEEEARRWHPNADKVLEVYWFSGKDD